MRRLSIVSALAVVAALVPLTKAPALTALIRSYGSHGYAIADVGNGVEASMATGPDGATYVAGGENDWIWVTTNRGLVWTATGPLGLPGLPNEGDVAVAPNGDVYVTWLDLSRAHAQRVYVRRADRPAASADSYEEKLIVGPQIFPDRPWIYASKGPEGSPDLGLISANTNGFRQWASVDGGDMWITRAAPTGAFEEGIPSLLPDPYLDYAAPAGFADSSEWMVLPGGGFLQTSTGYWTRNFKAWYQIPDLHPLRELSQTSHFEVAADGTIYQGKLAEGGYHLEYRFYADGAWSPWIRVHSFAKKGEYLHGIGSPVTEPLLALNSRADLLAFNARDGKQDVLVRVQNPKAGSRTVTVERIGLHQGSTNDCPDPGKRYDYPTLAFDRDGLAVVSFCAGMVAYQRP